MTQKWSEARKPFAVIFGPPALWLLVFFLVPLAIVWAYSFGRPLGLTETAITGTLQNYVRAFDAVYLGIFLKSIWFAALTTLLCLLAGFPIAIVLTFASARGRTLLLLAIMLPFWTNLLIRTYALMVILRTEGYMNTVIGWIGDGLASIRLAPAGGIGPLPLLHNNFAVTLGLVYVSLPFMVLPLYAALDRLDRSLLEASLDLGAGHLRTIREIVIPLAIPGILTGMLITFIPTLGSYLTPDLLGGPDSQMIANVIARQFKQANDWPFGAALSFILLYLTFFAIAVQSVVARRRERNVS